MTARTMLIGMDSASGPSWTSAMTVDYTRQQPIVTAWRHWSEVLDCDADARFSAVRAAFQAALKKADPDLHSGSRAVWNEVTRAYADACREHEVES